MCSRPYTMYSSADGGKTLKLSGNTHMSVDPDKSGYKLLVAWHASVGGHHCCLPNPISLLSEDVKVVSNCSLKPDT